MGHAKSESDVASVGTSSSSPASPKRRPYYYVQSPSRDSDADNKSSFTNHATPTYSASPMGSPSHTSQSRASSASRISGPFRSLSYLGRKGGHYHLFKKKNHHNQYDRKEWPPQFGVIDEEDGDYDQDLYDEERFIRRCRIVLALTGFVMVFTLVCLITWGVSLPYKFMVDMKSWKVNNFYFGEGSDYTGVPTKMMTVNCTVNMNIRNPAPFFGIHVSSTSVNLFFLQIIIGSGQLENYYQPKQSHRVVSVNLEGSKVPLYGAGAGLVSSDFNGKVPLRLEFQIRSRAYLLGKLVKTTHHRQVLCAMEIDSERSNVSKFKLGSCAYD